jgi:hypothetical protein
MREYIIAEIQDNAIPGAQTPDLPTCRPDYVADIGNSYLASKPRRNKWSSLPFLIQKSTDERGSLAALHYWQAQAIDKLTRGLSFAVNGEYLKTLLVSVSRHTSRL